MATGGIHVGARGGGTQIIVNNLPGYFTDEEFKSMFSHFGDLEKAHLVRNKTTNKSQGYGFVTFVRPADAARAIDEVNGLQLGNKKLRVAYPEPANEDLKNATKITIRKIPLKYDEDKLNEMCSSFGKVVKIRLLRDSVTNKSKRVGFAFFERWVDASRAVAELNGKVLEGAKHPMEAKIEQHVMESKQSSAQPQSGSAPYGHPYQRPQTQGRGITGRQTPGTTKPIPAYVSSQKSSHTVFLYNVGEHISENEIYNIFAQFGGLLKIDIVRDQATKLCKGYAFLLFDNKGSAENAIFTMDGMFYRGRQLQVRYKHG